MKRNVAWILALSLILQQAIPLRAETVTVPAGTSVIVKLLETVSSATQKKGDSVSLSVVSDVLVGGKRSSRQAHR